MTQVFSKSPAADFDKWEHQNQSDKIALPWSIKPDIQSQGSTGNIVSLKTSTYLSQSELVSKHRLMFRLSSRSLSGNTWFTVNLDYITFYKCSI